MNELDPAKKRVPKRGKKTDLLLGGGETLLTKRREEKVSKGRGIGTMQCVLENKKEGEEKERYFFFGGRGGFPPDRIRERGRT